MEVFGLVFLAIYPLLFHFLSRLDSRFYFRVICFFPSLIFAYMGVQSFLQESTFQFFGLKVDALSGLIATFVSAIGMIVTRFSIRYLEDDPRRDEFFRNISFALSSVLVALMANNFALFFGALLSSSFFLHHLLTHFKERKEAKKAAVQKFWISRMGDAFFLISILLILMSIGSLNFDVIFERVQNPELLKKHQVSLFFASLMMVAGVLTRSAQVPFHYWLPNTMETPTPVSALMHAGIINSGGYLLIRMSPFLAEFPFALNLLALIGALTAFYGSLVMMTQTDVKKALAYSTISQMGFMMLQCGVGAFSIATAHLIGHASYKAYAFLSSGTITEFGRLQRYYPKDRKEVAFVQQFLSLALSSMILFVISSALNVNLAAKPGALILSLILTLCMAQILLSSYSFLRKVFYSSFICTIYFAVYSVIRPLLSDFIFVGRVYEGWQNQVLSLSIGLFFVALFFIQNNLKLLSRTSLGERLYVWLYFRGVMSKS